MKARHSFSPTTVALVASAFVLPVLLHSEASAVGTRRFVLETAKDFESGQKKGVFVDSVGRLRPGYQLGDSALSDAQSIWSALRTPSGLLIGTGNEGKVFKYERGAVSEVVDTNGLAVTALIAAFGKTLVSVLPGGSISELRDGQLVPFATMEKVDAILGMAFDEKAKALYVATGPEGKLFRVAENGTSQVYFDSDQSHIVSVAVSGGVVYAGTSGKARLIRLDGPGRARVLRDFGSTEVRAIRVDTKGNIFAIANELKSGSRADSVASLRPAGARSADTPKGSGELFRFDPAERPERLFSLKDDYFSALELDAAGNPVVGTGSQGRVYAVYDGLDVVLLADVDERQMSVIDLVGNSPFLISSDPAHFHEVRSTGDEGTYTSVALDAGLRARFGHLVADSTGQVELTFRSGNTSEADDSWSAWSPPVRTGALVQAPPGRYLQVRAKLAAGAAVRRLEVPFVTDNLRATLTQVRVDSPSAGKGSEGLKASGGPIEGAPSTKIKVTFDVENPDSDELRFRVEYRSVSGQRWMPALAPDEVLTKTSWTWDTAHLPEGLYRLRVTVTDELSNPVSQQLEHSIESPVILVDNTPPRFADLRVVQGKLRGKVVDGLGPVQRIEARVGSGPEYWPLECADGIFDQASEEFSVELAARGWETTDFVTVRAFDAAGNSVVTQAPNVLSGPGGGPKPER